MKKTLSILFSILSLSIMAQVPQGVGYQGVATDANGIELVNQSISIKASVLSGSANGTVEWEETHTTSTDTFGLFTLTIGQGTNTTNGLQISFADISWGTNTYFLKIEMDVTGGSTYSFMGTNQMMSVPYALYAESANINYDSISNFLSGDSTFITNVGSGMGGGCDYSFPEGIEGQNIAWDLGANGSYQDYIVPAGKNLFITNVHTDYAYSFRIDGIVVISEAYSTDNANVSMLKHPICVKSGQVVSFDGPGAGPHTFYGILTDAVVEPISFWFDDPGTGFDTYTVPVGKRLIITNLFKWDNLVSLYIDGVVIASGLFNKTYATAKDKYLEIPLIINSGSIVSAPNHFASFNGYLVDENYFANCGGGGSSSSATSSLDSNTIANMIAAAGGGGGCNFSFPEGGGLGINEKIVNGSYYIVPAGKRFYITNMYNAGLGIRINNTLQNFQANPNLPIIANPGDSITNYSGSNPLDINGYLADENYFADCGGGSSSSSNNSNNISISQYGDTLYINGQAIVIPGVSQSNLNYHFHNYGTVMDADGNTYKTLEYGNNEWMIENLKTAIGNYETPWTTTGGAFAGYADSVGYYYSASDVVSNVCPTGWHVATIQDWQDLHYEIYGTNMNPTGYTNSSNGYDDNNYQILWSQHEGGTNQSAFNLFRTGYWSVPSSYITQEPIEASFWSPDGCNSGNLYKVNIDNDQTTPPWTLRVGCTNANNVKAQVRCVKD